MSLVETKKSTETIMMELKSLKLEHAKLLEKYEEALETIEELSKTAAEEIDMRDAELRTLQTEAMEQHRLKKKVQVSPQYVFLVTLSRTSPMPMTLY